MKLSHDNSPGCLRPWTHRLACWIADAYCVGAVVCLLWLVVTNLHWGSICAHMFLAFCVVLHVRLCRALHQGKERASEFFAVVGVLCLCSVLIVGTHPVVLLLAPIILQTVLLLTPSARHWCMQSSGIEKMRGWRRLLAGVARVIRITVLGLYVLFALMVLSHVPGCLTHSRLLSYASKDKMIEGESGLVRGMFDHVLNGTNYTVVVTDPIRVLASGPALFVYGPDGTLAESAIDVGDNPRFLERWNMKWEDVGHAMRNRAAGGLKTQNQGE